MKRIGIRLLALGAVGGAADLWWWALGDPGYKVTLAAGITSGAVAFVGFVAVMGADL